MGKNIKKLCGRCGSCQGANWALHYKLKHLNDSPMVLEDGMLPKNPLHVDWFYKLPGDIQKLYPKTQIMVRLGGSTAQNLNP
jgi:hypothetical protein